MTPGSVHLSLPFYYLFFSRLRSLQDRISWVFLQPLAQILVVFLYVPDFSWSVLALALVGMAAWQAWYEMGYLQNDAFTVERENRPTRRLTNSQAEDVRANFGLIASSRTILTILLIALIVRFESELEVDLNPGLFIGVCLTGVTAFQLHNMLRNKWNIATYFLLTLSRYSAVPILLVPDELVLEVTFLCLLMVALPRVIEHASKPKYEINSLHWILGRFHGVRVIYYAFASLLVAALVTTANIPTEYLFVFIYYLVFRLAVYVALQLGVVTPTIHKAYEKHRH